MEQAIVVLRKQGIARRAKKATRTTSEGAVASYIHAGGKIGVLVEVNCESDFVARTDDFQELLKDIAMHIAATDPRFIRKEDVTAEDIEREKEIYRAQAAATRQARAGGREDRRRQDGEVLRGGLPAGAALHQGPDHVDRRSSSLRKVGKLGENISVRRFARFKVGDAGETIAISKPQKQKPSNRRQQGAPFKLRLGGALSLGNLEVKASSKRRLNGRPQTQY